MKKRPEAWRAVLGAAKGAAAAAALAGAGGVPAQDLPEEALEDWYRVELLVFLREDAGSLGAERWEPMPELTYPDAARFLVNADLADRRLEESSAYASTIDAAGVQHLLLPAAFSPLDVTERPDSLILDPYREPAPDGVPAATPGGDGTENDGATTDLGTAPGPGDGAMADLAEPGDREEEIRRIALAAPYQLLANESLEFRAEARGLRRQGQRIAFHGAWWMHLPPDKPTPGLYLDRGADPDVATWPDLQGSVRIDRSRYLHIEVDLWLNTLAAYLPEGWRIDAPPLPPVSIEGRTLTGTERNPWAPELLPALAVTEPDRVLTPVPGGVTAILPDAGPTAALSQNDTQAMREDDEGEDEPGASVEELEPPYPWRHAIVHRQSRRMRSGEVHYLDHPVIGVVVKLLPAGDGLVPISGEDDVAFRERHGLPIEYVEFEAAESDQTGG